MMPAPFLRKWLGQAIRVPPVAMADRWGGSLGVRGDSDFREIWIGSGSSTIVSFIYPAFGSDPLVNPATVLNPAGADAGDFSRGFAFGAGNTFWGKGGAATCRHVQWDPFSGNASVIDSLAGFPNVAPIAVDVPNKLMAGVSIETPDNLRLFDLSNLAGAGMWNLDTEFFPRATIPIPATAAPSCSEAIGFSRSTRTMASSPWTLIWLASRPN